MVRKIHKKIKLIEKFDPEFRFLLDIDPAFESWRAFAAEFFKKAKGNHSKVQRALTKLFVAYLHGMQLDKHPKVLFEADYTPPDLWDVLSLDAVSAKGAQSDHDLIIDFLDWVLIVISAEEEAAGCRGISSKLHNPFLRQGTKYHTKSFDPEFRFLLKIDPAFENWRVLVAEFFQKQTKGTRTNSQSSLTKFFVSYLHGQRLDKRPIRLFEADYNPPDLWDALKLDLIGKARARQNHDHVVDLLTWVLNEKLAGVDAAGYRVIPSNLRLPFQRKQAKTLCKAADVEFRYLLELDPRLDDWQALACEWFNQQKANTSAAGKAIDFFLVNYILKHNLERNPYNFLRRDYPKPDFRDSMLECQPQNRGPERYGIRINNKAHLFLRFVLEEKLSIDDDNGVRLVPTEYHNPITKLDTGGFSLSETLKTPLAYRYIRELRTILAQGPNFRSWTWAQQALDSGGHGGDWFEVDPALVNEDDPDCVWRKYVKGKGTRNRGQTNEVIELWSPVRAVALYLKLELPLRAFQVRMLDSGEADTWRYESGTWRVNDSPLTMGSERRPIQRGVFHRSSSGSGTEAGAGFYINTNKTADINKDEQDKGYVIPWTHEPALFWLEKLRNWQEKYNPIAQPTPWRDLGVKHFGRAAPHPSVLEARGTSCFIFRDAACIVTSDRDKPIGQNHLNRIWFNLLNELEKRCEARGESLDSGSPIRFVDSGSQSTHFPLHSLRVSLITAYALDGGVPFPVLSKLIAGHARILMTLYYTKAGKAHVTEVMQEAERRILTNEATSYRRFLMEKSYQEIEETFAFNSPDALKAVSQQKSAASLVFEDKGICPVGCGMCDVGGDALTSSQSQPIYGPVPGYPHERNCVRCRFFLTGPAFIDGLQAHFNSASYQFTECAERYVRFGEQVQGLEDARLACEERGDLFTHSKELERINRYFEEEAEKANKLGHDMHAATHLINRCMAISNSKDKNGVRLVAVGGISDIRYALTETTSEMHQLEVMCENAVIYPEVDARKATLRRSQILDAMLQLNGRPPILFRLNTDQQLRVGNAVMQLIKARTGSIAGAVEFAEGRRRLADFGLLDEAVDLIEAETGGLAYRQLISNVQHGPLLTSEEPERENDYEA